LTEAVARPYCVILLDEIEKAHHMSLFNIPLQLPAMTAVSLTGRTVDFKNTSSS
jgi:ATP-dependent Clp protease ATP-binding subunit ClpB